MRKCGDCKENADYVFIFARSLFPVCKKHAAERILTFKSKSYIIPLEYFPESNKWPTPALTYENGESYSFGKITSDHKLWMRETDRFIPDMNIE